jgi:hypothetical protein
VYLLIDKHVQKAVYSTNGFSTTHMMSFALSVKKNLGEYNKVIKQKPITLAASLDPHIKSLLCHVGINTDQIKKDLVEEWNLIYEMSYNSAAAAYTDPPTSKGFTAETSSFLSLLNPPSTDSQVGSEPFSSEGDRWMAHSPMTINQSSREFFQWMKVSQGMYHRIKLMAREFLGVTSTSVPSESACSKAVTTVKNAEHGLVTKLCRQSVSYNHFWFSTSPEELRNMAIKHFSECDAFHKHTYSVLQLKQPLHSKLAMR